MEERSDAELLTELQGGAASAFDALYQRYRARLFSFLARMTGRRDVAEELLQETWLRLATRAPELRPGSDVKPWLFTVARNLATSHLRWRLIDRERMSRLGLWPGHGAETPFDTASASESERRLEIGLSALPPAYREALLLVAVEQMEPAAAAAVIGVRPDAFRKRLERARALLAERMQEGR